MKINPDDVSPLEKIMDIHTDWSGFDEESLITIGAEIVQHKKKAHRVLGRLAVIHEKLKKHSTLRHFSQEIGIGENTLKVYKSVEKRLDGLEVPEDLSWGALLRISYSDDPKKVLAHIVDEGLTSAMVIRLLSDKQETHKIIECPNCHKEIEVT
jgi:hypothetical protein